MHVGGWGVIASGAYFVNSEGTIEESFVSGNLAFGLALLDRLWIGARPERSRGDWG